MSVQNATAFIEKARADSGLKSKLQRVPNTSEQAAINELVKIAAGAGFHFTAQDYREALLEKRKSGELQAEDLSKVAGGVTITMTIACW